MDSSPAAAELPAPVDLSHFFSRVTKNRTASSMKGFYKYFSIPGIGNLAGGLPNASYFPYDTLEAAAALPHRFKPTPNLPVDPPSECTPRPTPDSSSFTSPASSRVVVPKASSEENDLQRIDLATALQYGTAQGYPPLYSFLHQFTRENLHPNIPYAGGPEIILTCGSTDGFSKTIEALSNVWDDERDWIREKEGVLCEEFAYMNAIQAASPRGLNVVPVAIDDEGMTASGKGGLAEVLENWDFNKGKRPHLMYTVTIGQNPTSGTLSVSRRKEIYALCVKYDIIIIEDDPYWYLQFPSANKLNAEYRGFTSPAAPGTNYNAAGRSSGFPFLDSLVPSYLSVDTQGRVVRLDTFSKTIAPGCRLGWITAQPNIIERILRITETSTQQPSGFVQAMVAELIMGPQTPGDGGRGGSKDGSGWKVDGWVRWLEGLRGNYERRMNTMCKILEEGKYHVKTSSTDNSLCLSMSRANLAAGSSSVTDPDSDSDDLEVISKIPMYDFTFPLGGMFIWLHMNLESHPLWGKISPPKLAHAMWVHLTKKPFLALVAPGEIFSPTKEIAREKGWAYFRLCFAAVDDDVIERCSRGVAEGFRSFWELKDLGDIEEDVRATEGIEFPTGLM